MSNELHESPYNLPSRTGEHPLHVHGCQSFLKIYFEAWAKLSQQ